MENRFQICEKYLKEFNEFQDVDIFEDTRQEPIIQYRQLFHTILRLKAKQTLQVISDYTEYKGRKCTHTTILNSVKRTLNTNYDAFEDIAEIYDIYFSDKKEKRKKKELNSYYYKHYTKRLEGRHRLKNTMLNELLTEIPDDKIEEICEMVRLRIKSWSWKSKDKCDVIESSSSISSQTF